MYKGYLFDLNEVFGIESNPHTKDDVWYYSVLTFDIGKNALYVTTPSKIP